MMIRIVLLLLVLLSHLFASESTPEKPRKRSRYDCENQIDRARERFEGGRFNSVKTILEEVKYQCGGHASMDTVLYMLGMAYLETGMNLDAEAEFGRLMRNYPRSVYFEEARFRLAHTLFLKSNPYDRDQADTYSAIRSLTEFVELYPGHPLTDSARVLVDSCYTKLARKEFENARFYLKINEYEAAIVYFKDLIAEFPTSSYVPRSQVLMAEALINVNRYTEAKSLLDSILSGSFSNQIHERARQLKERLNQRNL